jgi:hypothetical protein
VTASPRLTLALDGAWLTTDTAAELNIGTGLAASRVRAESLSFRPSAQYRISPRLTVNAASFTTAVKVADAPDMNAQVHQTGIEQAFQRDLLSLEYERGRYIFDDTSADATLSQVVRAGWTRDLGPHTRLTVQAGPRLTDGSASADLGASFTHAWRSSAVVVSALQTETTVVGYAGTVATRSLFARFTYEPTGSLLAYVSPAILRSTHRNHQAMVYRIGVGARYAMTPLLGVDVAYHLDSQQGSIDPLRTNANVSRGMLSVGFTSRLNPR